MRKLNEQEEAKLLSGEEDDLSKQSAAEVPSEREGSGENRGEKEEDRGSVSGYEGEDETDNEQEERLRRESLDRLDQERDMEEEEERAEQAKEAQQQ